MNRLKSILRWVVGLIIGSFLSVILFLTLPPCQKWLGAKVAQALSEQVGSKVEVGRIQLGLTGRLIIDEVLVHDLQGKEMLKVARAGAKLNMLSFLRNGDIHIHNALLFGAHAHLYQQQPESLPNFQFLIDAFKSNNEEKKPLPHISISSILVRHASVSYDQLWKPVRHDRFDPSHLNISELSLAGQLQHLTDDSLSFQLRKLSFVEQSGLQVKQAEGFVSRSFNKFSISNFLLNMPGSTVRLPQVALDTQLRSVSGSLQSSLTPADAQAFYPPLASMHSPVEVAMNFNIDTLSAHISELRIHSQDEAIDADIPNIDAIGIKQKSPDISTSIAHLSVKPSVLDYLNVFVKELPKPIEPLLNTLGETSLLGNIHYGKEEGMADVVVTTQQGQLDLNASLIDKRLKARFNTDGIELGHILACLQKSASASDSTSIVGKVALSGETDFVIPEKWGKRAGGDSAGQHSTGKSKSLSSVLAQVPSGTFNANIHEAVVKNYPYHNIQVALHRHGEQCDVSLDARDPALTLNFQGNANLAAAQQALQGLLDIEHFRPMDLHLTKKGMEDVRTKVGIDLKGNSLADLTGDISIPHLILTDKEGTATFTSLQLESKNEGDHRHIRLQSPYLIASADGVFEWADMARYLQQSVHQWIPGIVKAPQADYAPCEAQFSLSVTDPSPLERIAGIPLHLEKGPLILTASVNSSDGYLHANADAPSISYGSQNLLNFCFDTESVKGKMSTRLSASRMMKQKPVDIRVDIDAEDAMLTTHINWDNHLSPLYTGSIALRGNVLREAGQVAVNGEILPSTLQINDTVWNIRPTHITFNNGVLNVENFRMNMEDGDRWLAIQGKASKSTEDTLHVNLKDIELAYVFQLVKVKPLSLAGKVTGQLYGTHLFAQPEAHGHVVVPHMLFNNADMGTCDAQLAWGVQPGTLDIDADLMDPVHQAHIDAKGYLHLVKDPVQSLDLRFVCQNANMSFLNRYVDGIMEDIEGRATGSVNVYGTFGDVDLSGEADVSTASLTIPALNARYHVFNEHVTLRPDGLEMKDIKGYDPMGAPGKEDHSAVINGRITYNHFRDMRFHFDITGQNVLAYNFPEFDDLPFCGVVYGTGKVALDGRPGQTTIDIDAHPTNGTTLTYKVSTPETLTQSNFITFIDKDEATGQDEDGTENQEEEDKPDGDMHINFNIDLTPEAEMRLLMDPVAGDYISLFGNSRMRATYYNKGDFKMYGTYRVDHGIYRMSIQDVIRKDFQFRQGGTIVFGGNPFNADLGLQAIYTVPSVSLNDLSARGTFSNNNVRVNCLMNLGGKAGEPRITFDFDIPNVNDDELRMVRSLISTEEERNLQVIYLLGIGRFYTYDYASTQAQSSAAMNSLLSSTLSGQLNQMFTNLMGGNQNWNIGANLSTGDMGWSDMDVEGMLSGRLLNNRLLINGNFGYRDNPVAASNFIGDFDLQWILNKHGNLILKAYSETNDRYFTKSALTTQGVGILLKKDFIRWSDLFKPKKK